MSDVGSTLTRQDIAVLANVRRPVVSMWENRPTVDGVRVPFPRPVAVVDGVERFDRQQVVEYLARTGRGNNAEHAVDAPALSVPLGADLNELVTLLCWHVVTGEELASTTRGNRVDAARTADPTDSFLLREIAALAVDTEVLTFLDDLIEASFGAGDALARLEAGRLAREQAARELTADAVELLRAVVSASVQHLGVSALSVVHTDGLAVALRLADDSLGIVVSGDEPQARAARRRAAIRGLNVTNEGGSPRLSVSSVLGLEQVEALERIDEVVLALAAEDGAVIVGPASVLCEKLRGDADGLRSGTLRPGVLAAGFRLPRGLWREAPRQSLGIWVCRGGEAIRAPRVADLSALGPEELDLDDLASDVLGALSQSDARGYRYARQLRLERMLADGVVVPRGARAVRLAAPDAMSYVDRVHETTSEIRRPATQLDVLVSPIPGSFIVRQRSLGDLSAEGKLLVRRGSRIAVAHHDPAGTVPVLPEEVAGHLVLDAFDAVRRYPRATRTEPGDVIFLEKPRPRAWVDSVGGALVASPARILRLAGATGVGPQVLAAVINHLVPEGSEWDSWPLPGLPVDELAELEQVLQAAADIETEARQRAEAAVRLKTALVAGFAAGALTFTPPETDTITTHDKEVS